MTARIEHSETAGGTRTQRPATLTGTRRTYVLRSSTIRSLRALARESPEERETRRRANADAMREARARESREEGETQRPANAEAMREARARLADRSGSTVVHIHTKVAEASEATCNTHTRDMYEHRGGEPERVDDMQTLQLLCKVCMDELVIER